MELAPGQTPDGEFPAAGAAPGALWGPSQGHLSPQVLRGHRRSVRSLAFSTSASLLCSGSMSGEVRVWSVPASACVGCFQAHGGATEALTFLDDGFMLLSAGADHMVGPTGNRKRRVLSNREDDS